MQDTNNHLQETRPNSEKKLLVLLDSVGIDKLGCFLDDNSQNIKALVTQIAYGLDFSAAVASPKIFTLRTKLGKGNVIKLLCAVLKAFCDSIKASKNMDAMDMLECAEALEEKYTHDSIKDIILALKQAKIKGKKFYSCVDISVIMGICDEYFDSKAQWLEQRHLEQKNQFAQTRDVTLTLQKGMEDSMHKREKELEKELRKQKALLAQELKKQQEQITNQPHCES